MEDAGGLFSRFRAFVEKHSLIGRGDQITAGVSGGPDSVCLLFLLRELQNTLPFSLQVLHVNHMLRPSAAEEASYVDKLCKPMAIRCITVDKPVEKLAAKWKISLEEAGRRVRYEALRAAAAGFRNDLPAPSAAEDASRDTALREYPQAPVQPGETRITLPDIAAAERKNAQGPAPVGRSLIACAHHLDDQAETLLFRLFRGSGPIGLAGMRPRDRDVIRPLLFASKQEILIWLTANAISWYTDESNETDHFTRNRIRRHILPAAEKLVNASASRHTAQAAEKLGLLSDYLRAQAEEALSKCMVFSSSSCVSLSVPSFRLLHPALRPYVLMAAADLLSPETESPAASSQVRDLSASPAAAPECGDAPVTGRASREGGFSGLGERQLNALEGLFFSSGAKALDLPGDMKACREFDLVKLFFPAPPPAALSLPAVSLQDCPNPFKTPGEVPKSIYKKYFDYDKINSVPALRTRAAGDYLYVETEKRDGTRGLGKKTLKKLLIEQKIPVSERDKLPLLCDGSHVLWVIGGRISAYAKVSESTTRILEASIPEDYPLPDRRPAGVSDID